MLGYANHIASKSTVTFSCNPREMNTYRFSQNAASLNGVTVNVNDGTTQISQVNDRNIGLFCRFPSDMYGISQARPKISSFKAWKSDVLIMDLIPVRVGTTGYMYDTVSGELFGNAGTEEFILGSDIV